ncbi:MAG: hypothetical protein F4185_00840 [Chloroflexi bacterium]|nr:hypothetical protein [Chloroflexota bacterium]MYK35994.1 hypothetical protein [Chloroflexota bacterium]
MSTLAELAYRLSVDPALVDNQAWNAQTTAVSSALQSNAQLIREMEPVPSSVQHIHAELEALAVLLEGGFEAFEQGLESGEPSLVAIGDQQFQFVVRGGVRGRVGQAIAEYCG